MMNKWDIKELGLVSAIHYGYTESASNLPIGPRFLRITDIQNDQVDWESVPYCPIPSTVIPKFRLASGDIVFARTGATTGKSYLVVEPPEAVFASYLIRLRLTDDRLQPEFVSYFFQSEDYWKAVKDGSTGSAQGGFNATKLAALRIPIPPPQEQQRIVTILDEAFEGIATAKVNAEKNLQNAGALNKSYLQSVFDQRGPDWKEKSLQDLADSSCTLSYGIVQPGDEEPNGLPVVRPTDLTTRIIRLSGLKRIDPILAKAYRRTILRGGDLLLCVRGSTGALSVASAELLGANVTRGIVPIRFKADIVSPDFSFYLLSSESFQSQIREKTYGAALMQINIRDLRNITVSYPPLIEQEIIAIKLDELDKDIKRLECIYLQKLNALEVLKRSLLHRAFTGQL